MFEKLINNIVSGVARHLLTAAAGWLVTQGYLDASQQDALLGAGLFFVGLALSITDKVIAKKKANSPQP